ncbi:kelch domain-containing protein 8A-like [Haliotis asinina]|uniref:kelch domain-containing protein 8A-like n=1 Tax=Haliotis asinina TaxID=109174 RepID=UPI0035319A63
MSSGSFRWQSMKSMPTKRVFATPVTYQDCLYVVGGCDEKGAPLDNVEVYDMSEKEVKWKKLSPMPTKRAGPGVAALKNKIIVIGGVSEAQNPLDVVEVYDIEKKEWTTGESMIEPLLGMSVLVKDGKILVIGGMGKDTNPNDYFFELDIDSDPFKWRRLPGMPTARYASATFCMGSDLFVIGGRQGKIPTDAFEVYHFETKKWEKLPAVPSKRVFPMYVTDDTNIYSLGGLQQPPDLGFSDVCEVFNIEKKTWKVGTPMPTKRGDMAAGIVGGKVVCAGGLGNTGKPLQVVEAYDPASNTWTEISNLPTTHCSCACIMFKNRLHVIGGLSLKGPSSCMEALSYS